MGADNEIMKVDYLGRSEFGERYKKLKSESQPGWWISEENYRKMETAIENLLERHDVPQDGRFLDLGCGAGNITLFMAGKGFEAYGIDAAPEAIAWAQERMHGLEIDADFRVGNIVDLAPYSDDFFDFVFDGECLHCIIGQDRETCLGNVFRVLKRGGLFYVQGNCMDETLEEAVNVSPGVYFEPQSQCLMRNGVPYYYLSREEELLTEIREVGFMIAHCERIPKTPEHAPFQAGGLLVDAVKP